ncbi:MAG: DnaJ C-terminal domain-containing protein [Myxococcota bacterium]
MPRGEDDLYAVLGVSSSATQSEIQAAYKKLARELHPDVNRSSDAEDRFKQLVDAYAVLKDERKRARYDAFGAPQHGANSSRRGTRYEDIRVGTEDLRTGTRSRWRRATRAPDVRVEITLAEAYRGTTVMVEVPPKRPFGGPHRVKLHIPPGARSGDRLRLDSPPVTVVLTVDPGPFELEGRDVRTQVNVSPWEAALGCTLSLDAPQGVLELKIPPGTSSGTVLRLRHQGLPVKPDRTGSAGHMYVEVMIAVPKELTQEERRLFAELAEVSRFFPRSGTPL